jgi:hypothetical protein
LCSKFLVAPVGPQKQLVAGRHNLLPFKDGERLVVFAGNVDGLPARALQVVKTASSH